MKCLLVLSWLISYGYQEPEALGIVNNLYAESKCDPNASNKHQIGIAQWQGKRQLSLRLFAQKTNTSPFDLNTQLLFLHHEWQKIRPNTHRSSHIALNSTYFTLIFCQKFEKPRDARRICPKRTNNTSFFTSRPITNRKINK